MCEALHSAHRRGVVHRDLKPGNIIIREEGYNIDVKILDWGLGKRLEDKTPDPKSRSPRRPAFNLTMPGEAFGTGGYIAPEIFRVNVTPDIRSDVLQMGVILYELTTQRMPFASLILRGKRSWMAISLLRVGSKIPPPSAMWWKGSSPPSFTK